MQNFKKNEKEDKYISDIFEGTDSCEKEGCINDELVESENNTKKERAEKLKEIGMKTLKAMGIVAIVIFIGYSIFSESNGGNDNQNIPSESEIKETALKNELVEKHNAIVFDDNNYIFSKDFQENLDKNFLIEGWVHDIFKENDKYFIKVEGSGYFGIFESSDDNINYIIESKDDNVISDDFFIVIKLDAVSKALFEMKAERDGEDTYAYNESSDDFLLKGAVLDIKKID